MRAKNLANLIEKNLADLKAEDILVIDVKKLTDIADYMIVCTGTSSRHINAMGKSLAEMVKHRKIELLGIEAEPMGTWTLVDLGRVIVHIMLPNTREFYSLEKLWSIKLPRGRKSKKHED